MGLFGHLLGKKKDPLADIEKEANMPLGTPPMGSPYPGGSGFGSDAPPYGEPMGSPDMGGGLGTPTFHGTSGGLSPEAFGFEKVTEKDMAHQDTMSGIHIGKDLEIISAKLDAIKAELDSVNQRLKRMERIVEGEQAFGKDKWSY